MAIKTNFCLLNKLTPIKAEVNIGKVPRAKSAKFFTAIAEISKKVKLNKIFKKRCFL